MGPLMEKIFTSSKAQNVEMLCTNIERNQGGRTICVNGQPVKSSNHILCVSVFACMIIEMKFFMKEVAILNVEKRLIESKDLVFITAN